MERSSAFSMKNVAAVLDGQKVVGFWDGDDVVQVEQMEDVGVMMVGADGSSIFSQSANEGTRITLRLQHTSPTHRLLATKLATQRAPGIKVTGSRSRSWTLIAARVAHQTNASSRSSVRQQRQECRCA